MTKSKKIKLIKCPLCRHKVEELNKLVNLELEEDIKGCEYCLFDLYYKFGQQDKFNASWDLIMKFDHIIKSLEMFSDSE